MADILVGQSGHNQHAPLSNAQTLAISKHLQEQIGRLDSRFAALSQGLGQTNEGLAKANKALGLNAECAHALQDSLAATRRDLDVVRKDVGRTGAVVSDVQAGVRKVAGEVLAVQEEQKTSRVDLDRVCREALQTHQLSLRLRDDLEKRVTDELSGLSHGVSKIVLDVQQLRDDEGRTRSIAVEQREALRDTNATQGELQDTLGKTNGHIGMIEHRLADTSAYAQEAQKHIDNLSALTAQLRESHDHTRATTQTNQVVIKKLGNAAKTNRDCIDNLKTNLARSDEKLREALATLDSARQEREQNRQLIGSLKQSQSMAQMQLDNIRGELAENNATTLAVKQGLKDASTLLLPNIHADSSEAPQTVQRHGQGQQMPRLQTAPTPRRPHNSSRLGMASPAPDVWT